MKIKMTRKGDFVLRQLADEYVLIPYGATTEKMNQVLTLSETAAFIYEQTGDAASAEEIAERLGKAYDVPAEEVQEDVSAVLETFRNCDCKSKPQKKNYAVHASASMVSRARYSEKLSTAKYIELTRLRNAIEGIPSVLRRKYHIDEIPVFGKLRSRQFFLFKIGAYNFGKLFRHNRRLQVESAQNLVMS